MGNEQAKVFELKAEVLQLNEKLRLSDVGRERSYLRILLVGPKGSGRSSVITSINAALSGSLTQVVGTRHSRYGFREYEVDISQGTEGDLPETTCPALFTLCDFEGFGLQDSDSCLSGFQTLLNNLEQDYGSNTRETRIGGVGTGTRGHLAMVCLVAEASLFHDTGSREEPYIDRLKEIKKLVDQAEIPKALFLTKVDRFPTIQSNIQRIPKSQTVRQVVTNAASRLGMFPNRIFPVKSFTTETTAELTVSFQFLQVVAFLLKDMTSVHRKVCRQLSSGSGELPTTPTDETNKVQEMDKLSMDGGASVARASTSSLGKFFGLFKRKSEEEQSGPISDLRLDKSTRKSSEDLHLEGQTDDIQRRGSYLRSLSNSLSRRQGSKSMLYSDDFADNEFLDSSSDDEWDCPSDALKLADNYKTFF